MRKEEEGTNLLLAVRGETFILLDGVVCGSSFSLFDSIFKVNRFLSFSLVISHPPH